MEITGIQKGLSDGSLVILDKKHTFWTGTGSGLGVADALGGKKEREKGRKKHEFL